MSLSEIEEAVKTLTPEELTKLAALVTRQDRLGWDEQIKDDFPWAENTPGSWRNSTLRLTPESPRRCREVSRAGLFLEVL
ncbi:MAG: hypothetical protein ACR2NX_16805 [Chthoniobacterales bacterium]